MADAVDSRQNPLTQFSITEPSQGYWTATKRLARERTQRASVDEYRQTLAVLRALIVSPSTTARSAAVARRATAVGPDFEVRMGHHLGLVEESTEIVRG
jgi:hypothetical protein